MMNAFLFYEAGSTASLSTCCVAHFHFPLFFSTYSRTTGYS